MSEKRCIQCQSFYPATTEFFNTKTTAADGLTLSCTCCLTPGCKRARHAEKPQSTRIRVNGSGLTELRCGHCKQWFPATVEYFYNYKGTPLDLSHNCRSCHRAIVAKTPTSTSSDYRSPKERQDQAIRAVERQRREAERLLRQQQRTIETQQQEEEKRQKQVARQQQQERDRAERERLRIERHEAAVAHRKEAHKSIEKRYRQSEKGKRKVQSHTQRKRARKNALPATLTKEQWQFALDYFGHRCAVCGVSEGLFMTLAQDHWIPISDKRSDNPGTVATNIVPLCHAKVSGVRGCNNLKRDRDASEWLLDTFGQRKADKIEKRIMAYFEKVR